MKRKLPGITPTLGARGKSPAAFERRCARPAAMWVPLLALAAFPAGISAQNEAGAATITADDLRLRIGALAHDSMRGRATPSPELDKAARHIARRFEEFGLQPADGDSYLQEYPLTASRAGSPDRQLLDISGPGGGTIDVSDYLAVPGGRGEAAGPLAIVTLGGAADPPTGAVAVMRVTPEETRRGLESVRGILDGGAVAVLLAVDAPDDYFAGIRRFYERERLSVGMPEELGAPVALVRARALPEPLRAALASGAGTTAYEATVRTYSVFREERAFNTIGWIEGSDPDLRGEFVVFTAHMDHVGVGRPVDGDSIYNGADDDASRDRGDHRTRAGLRIAGNAAAPLPRIPHRERGGARTSRLGVVCREPAVSPRGDGREPEHRHDRTELARHPCGDRRRRVDARRDTAPDAAGTPGARAGDDRRPVAGGKFLLSFGPLQFCEEGCARFSSSSRARTRTITAPTTRRTGFCTTRRRASRVSSIISGSAIADADERPEWDPAAYRRVVEGGGR